jgi:phenylacetate-CoA ligase
LGGSKKMIDFKAKIYYFLEKIWKNWQKIYKEIEKGKFDELQNKYLEKILLHAYNNVPYYQEVFDKVGLIKSSKVYLEKFQEIPILTKEIIRKRFNDLTSKDLFKRKWFKNSSGGSTGEPQTFIQDNEYQNWVLATQIFYFKKFLNIFPYEVKKVNLSGSERDLFRQKKSLVSCIGMWLKKEIFLNTFKVSPEDWIKYVEIINREKPYYIKAYASSIYQMARIIKEKKLHVWSPRFIYSTAETLMPFMRQVIEEVFRCKVYDFYGSREVGAIAGECVNGKMHIFNFNNYAEIVNEKGESVKPGEMGRVLVTTLHNYSMPLIRYEIGDTAILGNRCSCGVDTPILERVTGRITDNFKNKNGDIIHGEYFTHLFYFRKWIKSFQVLQEKLDKITIFFVPSAEDKEWKNTEEIREIEEKIRLVMGKDCEIEWQMVKEIPPTIHGKHLFTRSLIYRRNE